MSKFSRLRRVSPCKSLIFSPAARFGRGSLIHRFWVGGRLFTQDFRKSILGRGALINTRNFWESGCGVLIEGGGVKGEIFVLGPDFGTS